MSNNLLKVYGVFIIITVTISSFFLYIKNGAEDKIVIDPSTYEVKKVEDNGVIIPPSTEVGSTSTSSKQNAGEFKKVVEVIPTTSSNISKPTQNTSNQTQTVIDIVEVDSRTSNEIPNPCISPILYKLGIFDLRFNISKNYFLQTIDEASALWNEATSKKLFEYSANETKNVLTINLIYDYRQQATDASKLISAEIENSKNAAMAIKVEYEALKETFLILKEEYASKIEAFELKQKAYSESVAYWNEKGGAPRNEYDALMLEKEQLQREGEALTLEQKYLTTLLDEINAKISKYNELISFSNERVDVNNTTADRKFTEGSYNPNTNTINIYQFYDETKLRRVLAHELGHVLGIDHTQSEDSIMYAINNATSTILNSEDLSEVQNLCQ